MTVTVEQVSYTPKLGKIIDKLHNEMISDKLTVAEGMFVLAMMLAEGILEFGIDEDIMLQQVRNMGKAMREAEDENDAPTILLN